MNLRACRRASATTTASSRSPARSSASRATTPRSTRSPSAPASARARSTGTSRSARTCSTRSCSPGSTGSTRPPTRRWPTRATTARLLLDWFEEYVALISLHKGGPAKITSAMGDPDSPILTKCQVLTAASDRVIDRLRDDGALRDDVETHPGVPPRRRRRHRRRPGRASTRPPYARCSRSSPTACCADLDPRSPRRETSGGGDPRPGRLPLLYLTATDPVPEDLRTARTPATSSATTPPVPGTRGCAGPSCCRPVAPTSGRCTGPTGRTWTCSTPWSPGAPTSERPSTVPSSASSHADLLLLRHLPAAARGRSRPRPADPGAADPTTARRCCPTCGDDGFPPHLEVLDD